VKTYLLKFNDPKEFKRWKGAAHALGISLAKWIKGKCNGDLMPHQVSVAFVDKEGRITAPLEPVCATCGKIFNACECEVFTAKPYPPIEFSGEKT
jgi:hypothetical protein